MSMVLERVERVEVKMQPTAVCDQCGKREALDASLLPEDAAFVPRAYWDVYPIGWVRAAEVSSGTNVEAGAYCSWACLGEYSTGKASMVLESVPA